MAARGQRLSIFADAVVLAVEVLGIFSASTPAQRAGQIVVAASAAVMLALVVAAARGRAPAPRWTLVTVVAAGLGATLQFIASRHRKVDVVGWVAILVACAATFRHASKGRKRS